MNVSSIQGLESQSKESEKPNICIYDVGGKEFSFSRSSIKRIGDIGWNVFSTMYSKNWGKGDRFVDVNPKIFEKWFDPYIRHGLLPEEEEIKDLREKRIILAAANVLGLPTAQ